MAKLLDVYESMVKEAAETQEDEQLKQAQVEALAKYAHAADDLLAAEYGEDYTQEDVEKLASMMIEHDLQEEAEEEKTAEWDEAGRQMARAFIQELNSIEE